MSTVDADMIDSIITKQGVKTGAPAFDILAADTERRPFVSFAKCVGAACQITIGGRVVHDAGDTTYAGFAVGNNNEAIQVAGGIGDAYVCTCGYMKVRSGDPKSATQDA